MAARADRSGMGRFWSVWRVLSVASQNHRKAVAQRNSETSNVSPDFWKAQSRDKALLGCDGFWSKLP